MSPRVSLPALACAAVLVLAARGAADPVGDAYLAVVQIPSHGASGTVIATAPGETFILTAAHAFEGAGRHRPIVLLVPSPEGAEPEKRAGIRLVALDARADLALVLLRAGPLPHVARVAPRGGGPVGRAWSVGYDGMRLPAVCVPTRLRGGDGATTFTHETPRPGRSGGALLDGTGRLIGVVQGYTLERPSVGLYVSLGRVHAFLGSHGYGRLIDAGARREALPPAGPGAGAPAMPVPARPCPD